MSRHPCVENLPHAPRCFASFRVCLILFAVLFLSRVPQAGAGGGEHFWDAGGDGSSWSDPFNWNPDFVPNVSSEVKLNPAFGGSIYLSSSTTIEDLEIGELNYTSLTVSGSTLSLWLSALIHPSGEIRLQSSTLDGSVTNLGTLFLEDGGTVPYSVDSEGVITAYGSANSIGTFSATYFNQVRVVGRYADSHADLAVGGNFVMSEGELTLTSEDGSTADAVLLVNSGSLQIGGNATLYVHGGPGDRIIYVYDSVTNDGGIETGQVTRFVVPVNFTNNGYLNNNAYTVIEQGNFVNNGDLYISAGTQFRVDGGASTLGGRMTGGGHFENSTPLTPVEVSGRIEPGLPGETGTFHFVGGNTVHWSTFQLVAELGGEFPFQPYDRLEIAGNCQLDGVLQIDHLPGFAPAVGDSFEVLACTQGGLLTGSFLVHNGLVQDGITLAPVYFPDRLVLVVQSVTGVEEGGPPEEARFAVRHTPGDVARFEFVLPWDGQVEIGLFDLSGRSVGRLGPMDSGEGRGELAWSTRALASGAYFAKLLARPLDGPGDITLSGRLLVTR